MAKRKPKGKRQDKDDLARAEALDATAAVRPVVAHVDVNELYTDEQIRKARDAVHAQLCRWWTCPEEYRHAFPDRPQGVHGIEVREEDFSRVPAHPLLATAQDIVRLGLRALLEDPRVVVTERDGQTYVRPKPRVDTKCVESLEHSTLTPVGRMSYILDHLQDLGLPPHFAKLGATSLRTKLKARGWRLVGRIWHRP